MAKDDDEGEEKGRWDSKYKEQPSQASSEQAADDLMFSSSESEDLQREWWRCRGKGKYEDKNYFQERKKQEITEGSRCNQKQKPKPGSGEAIPRSHHTHEQLKRRRYY